MQPGDVVSIFSQADFRVPIGHQTKQITLDGEFAHAGVYTAQEGETLRHLVERAGGLTPNAYLYGSEFTRLSTRAVQQARIDEYIQSLGMQIERNNLALAASSVSQPQDLASSAAATSNERDLVASLRQIGQLAGSRWASRRKVRASTVSGRHARGWGFFPYPSGAGERQCGRRRI